MKDKLPDARAENLLDQGFMSIALDLTILVVPLAIGMRMHAKVNSRAQVEQMLYRWSHIEWDNDNISIYDKKKTFFEGVT